MIPSTDRAARIIALADELGVALSGDQGTIEALSRLNVDETIPRELYAVVAETLTYLLELDTPTAS
jgi:type III secretion system FlhB-like substrate exporter